MSATKTVKDARSEIDAARAELEEQRSREQSLQHAREVVTAYEAEQREARHQAKVEAALETHREIQGARLAAREEAISLGILFLTKAREAEELLGKEQSSRNVVRAALAGPDPKVGHLGIDLDLNIAERGDTARIPEQPFPVAGSLDNRDADTPDGLKARLRKAGLLDNPGGRDDLAAFQGLLSIASF
jgi:hypothetical protein